MLPLLQRRARDRCRDDTTLLILRLRALGVLELQMGTFFFVNDDDEGVEDDGAKAMFCLVFRTGCIILLSNNSVLSVDCFFNLTKINLLIVTTLVTVSFHFSLVVLLCKTE